MFNKFEPFRYFKVITVFIQYFTNTSANYVVIISKTVTIEGGMTYRLVYTSIFQEPLVISMKMLIHFNFSAVNVNTIPGMNYTQVLPASALINLVNRIVHNSVVSYSWGPFIVKLLVLV